MLVCILKIEGVCILLLFSALFALFPFFSRFSLGRIASEHRERKKEKEQEKRPTSSLFWFLLVRLLDILHFSPFLFSLSASHSQMNNRLECSEDDDGGCRLNVYSILYVLWVTRREERERKSEREKMRMHARRKTYTIGKKKREKGAIRSLALLSCAIHFCEQARKHKWPCMYHDRMRDIAWKRKVGREGERGESERSKKHRKRVR